MAGKERFGTVEFEILLDSDRRIYTIKRPRVSVRVVPGSNLVVTNYGGMDPPILKGTMYSASAGKATYNGLAALLGSEQPVVFTGRSGNGILMILDNPRFAQAGDEFWADFEIMLTRW